MPSGVANHRCLESQGRSFLVARWRFLRTIWTIAHNPSNSPKTTSPPSTKTMMSNRTPPFKRRLLHPRTEWATVLRGGVAMRAPGGCPDEWHPRFTGRLNGTALRRATPSRAILYNPDWSPNGRWLSFRSQEQWETRGNIAWSIPTAAGPPHRQPWKHKSFHAHSLPNGQKLQARQIWERRSRQR